MAIGSAAPASWAPMPNIRLPLFAAAGGKVIAAQLTADDLTGRLPAEPYPALAEILDTIAPPEAVAEVVGNHPPVPTPISDLASPAVHNRADLDQQLSRIRTDGRCVDIGEIGSLGCIAVPWKMAGTVASLAVLGSIDEIITRADSLTAVLQAAAAAAATRERIVVVAAAEHS